MLILPILLACTTTPPADLVLHGELVMPTVTTQNTRVQVRAGKIDGVVIGEDAPEGALRADLITAGFVDAHGHPAGLGRLLDEINLTGTPTLTSTLALIAKDAGDGWLVGRGWDQNDWTDHDGTFPTSAQLDVVTKARPAALRRIDGHALWANTAAMKAAKITAATKDPAGGQIIRDASGKPTGVFVDNAMSLIPTPTPTVAQRRARLTKAVDAIASVGLTGVHDMGVSDNTLALYTEMAKAGTLKVRIWAYLDPSSKAAARLLKDGPWTVGRLKVVGIKAVADGALGSRGAHLGEDYSDKPGHKGLVIDSTKRLTELATGCLKVRAQLAVHAIGDAGITSVLDAFQAARKAVPEASDVALRVEHAQVVRPNDLPRFAALNAIASMQPTHATSDLPWAGKRLGDGRLPWGYAWRTIKNAGATIAFGSDFPIESHDPSKGLWAAVYRSSPESGEPTGGYSPNEAFTLQEAVAAFTLGPAQALGVADELGTPQAGKSADLTLWKRTKGPGGKPSLKAIATIVQGDVVWKAK